MLNLEERGNGGFLLLVGVMARSLELHVKLHLEQSGKLASSYRRSRGHHSGQIEIISSMRNGG